MKPITFKEHNIILAENDKTYLPLPAFKAETGEVITCWKVENMMEWVMFIITGKLYVRILTFNKPLQPQDVEVRTPFTK